MVKAVLMDFDGTLVREDLLDVVCEIVGKREESEKINRQFQLGLTRGQASLIRRINFLKNVSLSQIAEKLQQKDYLTPGARELIAFLKKDGLVSILYSGNIVPIVQNYQHLLGIDYIVGTYPQMSGDIIKGIREVDFAAKNSKILGLQQILKRLSIDTQETIAIGDSPSDKAVFEIVGKSIAINPKNGIEQFADYTISSDLSKVIGIIQSLNCVQSP